MRDHQRARRPQVLVLAGGALVVVVLVSLAIAGCGGGGADEAATSGSGPPATTSTEAADPSTEQPPETVELVPTGNPIGLNDEGPRVERLQKALADLGFDPGPIDGIFGPRTERAVTAFQTSADLEPTGIVNSQTADALNNALTGLAG